MKIIIRVDGGMGIGWGHVMRCIALAHMLKSNYSILFVLKIFSSEIVNRIVKNGFDHNIIEHEIDLFDLFQKGDLVVLDGYSFSMAYQKVLKARQALVMCIDDLNVDHFFSDIVLNQAPGIKIENISSESYTKKLIGPNYTLLLPSFLNASKQLKDKRRRDSVFICFGGQDAQNFTLRALKTTVKRKDIGIIYVVVGFDYLYLDDLQGFIQQCDLSIHIYQNLNSEDLLNIMLLSDIGIVPASGILLETLATGNIAICGYYVENQRLNFEGYLAENIIIPAYNFEDKSIENALETAIKHKSTNHLIFDGNSGKRILSAINDLENEV